MSRVFLAAALLAAAGPALAQTATQAVPQPVPPANASPTAKNDVNKVVCQEQDTIGSRLQAHKVCMTVSQWKEFQAANRQETETMQGLSGIAPSH